MTDNDKNWGPFTLARWKNRIAFEIESGDDEDPESCVRMMAFGWALRCRIPMWVCPPIRKKVEANWDEATVKRLGRNWYYDVTERCFGVSLSNMGNGYDFLQVSYGASTHDSRTDKSWCKHLPWKQWRCVRHSVYEPDGKHFATEQKGKGSDDFFAFMRLCEQCPASKFLFRDYDGQEITATCHIEEREWHRGEGWFKWLKWFWPKKIRRSLDIKFSAEVGSEKGSWKGGTTGHGIEMLPGENPQGAFVRYCAAGHRGKGRTTPLTFIGPV